MLFHLEPYVILREKTSIYLKSMKILPFSMVSSKKKKSSFLKNVLIVISKEVIQSPLSLKYFTLRSM